MKIIIDTSVTLAAFIKPNGVCALCLEKALTSSEIELVTSIELIEEGYRKATSKKLRKYGLDPKAMIKIHISSKLFSTQKLDVYMSPDIGDRFLEELCLVSESNFLITGDKALQTVGAFFKTKIISPKEFLNL
jgi:putative PIN family toxin of toxin-antitoxin system